MGILSWLFRRGHSITPAQALACISNRPMLMQAGALDALIATAQAMPDRGTYREDGDYTPHGSQPEHLIEIENGIGVLSIEGPLFARFGIESWWYGGSAYNVIGAAFDMLLADAGVNQIVLLIDSPGGTVTGCFELADKIHAARGTKPITAVANDSAYSAAYAIASAADRIIIPRSGGLGSIGVRCQHVDISRALDRIGYTVTTIVSGAKKADFDSAAPLSESARSEMQVEVDRLADIFIETVARNRGIDADAVRALQAGCLFGPSAIAAGLGDAIGTIESVGAEMPEPEDVPEDLPDDDEDAATEEARISASLHEHQLKSAALIDNLESLRASAGVEIPGAVELAFAPEDRAKMDRAEVADAISASGLPPALAMALLSPAAAVTPGTAAARIAHAKALADICAAAGLPDVAADYATKHTDLETARAQLIAAKSEDGPEIVTSHPAKSAGSPLRAAAIYEERRKATE